MNFFQIPDGFLVASQNGQAIDLVTNIRMFFEPAGRASVKEDRLQFDSPAFGTEHKARSSRFLIGFQQRKQFCS